jgi:membrane associated rhomboid family serine protease
VLQWDRTTDKPALLRRTIVFAWQHFEKDDISEFLALWQLNFDWDDFVPWLKGSLRRFGIWALIVVGVLGGTHLVNAFVFHYGLNSHGIRPREFASWPLIFVAPFLHNPSWDHLVSNIAMLLVYGLVLCAWGWRELIWTIACGVVASGVAVLWFGQYGSPSHIGASGVVYSMFGYIVARGIASRNPMLLAISFSILLFLLNREYNGIINPQPGTSVEAHLGGLTGGVAAALFMWVF